jgi:maltose alpha-D-glucosyltransferase / alpha-amylase
MHRFMPFQPDLNINNPLVRNEIHKVIGFWLELGPVGVPDRCRAVPHRAGGPGQPGDGGPARLPARHPDFASRRRGDTMLLAEANEPLDKLANFFGERGNQMHMLFSFMTNQALYLSFVRHDATPVADALRSLPPTPPESQWANFIKNHDERRSTSSPTGSARRSSRPSRRRSRCALRPRHPSPLPADGGRRSAAHGARLQPPLQPAGHAGAVLRRGDRPGRQPQMAERESVRLPMQWANRPGGGFTTADESTLPRKLLRDGPFGYRQLNVEDQRQDRGSFLNWTERAIRTRKEWPEFGWGEWQVLGTRNPKVLAHVATWDGSSALAIHNFSDQPAKASVQLPKEARSGRWRHLFGPLDAEAPSIRGPAQLRAAAVRLPLVRTQGGRVDVWVRSSASMPATSSSGRTGCCAWSRPPRRRVRRRDVLRSLGPVERGAGRVGLRLVVARAPPWRRPRCRSAS